MNFLAKLLLSLLTKLLLLILLLGSDEAQAQRKTTSVRIEKRGVTSISVNNGFGNRFKVEFKGDIKLTDDDADISAISPGGYMDLRKTAFGSKRRIYIESSESGSLTRKYYVGGSEKSFDGEGKKWLAEVLLEVVRHTTLGSKERVDRIYKKSGTYGVLKEVGNIENDRVKTVYIKHLLDKSPKEENLLSILNVIREGIDSDYHKATLLKRNAKQFLGSPSTAASYIQAASSIDSDHHKAEVLKTSLKGSQLQSNQFKSLCLAAKDIDSDYHKASVLSNALRNPDMNAEALKTLMSTARSIDSDHHRASVIKNALTRAGVTSSSYHTMLSAMDGMTSDHHRDDVLSKMLNQSLDDSTLEHVLKNVNQMDSDSHRAHVLKRMVRNQSFSKENINTFSGVLNRLSSDHHKSDVLKSASRLDLDGEELVTLFDTAKGIDSDYHKTEALLALSSKMDHSDSSMREAYRAACKSINSDSHYRRAIDKLD
ncbi:MAG: hypothetical protein AAGL29_08440 [Bacteroidota bacterium]